MPAYTPQQISDWMATQPRRISSAAIMLENVHGELLIIKANYKPYWTLPGGVVDDGETPKQAAIREVQEEVGLKIEPATVEFIAVVDRISQTAQTYQFLFKAQLPADALTQIVLQEAEIDEYMFIKKSDIMTNQRPYAKAILHWANGTMGYIEQMLEQEEGKNASNS